MIDLDQYRRFFAEEVAAAAGLDDPRLVEAFAAVRREDFLGPGPWQIATIAGFVPTPGARPRYRTTTDADPRHLCHNVVVAIDASRALNNGQPGALATWIGGLAVERGDHVYHVGCGVGYYTAILAHLAGSGGHVTGVEIDGELAARAAANLASVPWVEVLEADAAVHDPGPVDIVFVNAGVTHPLRLWLERLRPGGRMLVPLTVAMGAIPGGSGFMLRVTREAGGFGARFSTPVAIYSCSGVRRESSEGKLRSAMARMTMGVVRSLRLDAHDEAESCWLHDEDYCLSTEALGA